MDEQTSRDELERWIAEHGPAVVRFLGARLSDRSTVDDLVQETFLRAWQKRARYVEQGQLRSWLIRIADRLATDRSRRQGRESRLTDRLRLMGDPSEPVHPERGLIEWESSEQLHEAMTHLPEAQRRTLLLRFFGELSFVDIAREMGCPLNTALSHCRRGLERLRQLLVEA